MSCGRQTRRSSTSRQTFNILIEPQQSKNRRLWKDHGSAHYGTSITSRISCSRPSQFTFASEPHSRPSLHLGQLVQHPPSLPRLFSSSHTQPSFPATLPSFASSHRLFELHRSTCLQLCFWRRHRFSQRYVLHQLSFPLLSFCKPPTEIWHRRQHHQQMLLPVPVSLSLTSTPPTLHHQWGLMDDAKQIHKP